MDEEVEQAGRKKSYEPPRLTTISLRPEEAVLGIARLPDRSGRLSLYCSLRAELWILKAPMDVHADKWGLRKRCRCIV